jgi:hypothetical protein
MSRWFRFYEGALDDPKVQRLSPPVFKGWVNLLCLASKHKGKLPSIQDIAFALRLSDHEADSLIQALMSVGLIDDVGGGMQPHKWYERQYEDATNKERQRKFRERKKVKTDVTRYEPVTDVTDNGAVTSVDTDTETDTETEKKGKARKRAAPIPEGFPFEADIRWTLKEHAKLSAWTEAEKFRDYALAHRKTYADWPAAWRTWCRNAERWSAERKRA